MSLWGFYPSKVAPALFAALYFVTGVAHSWQTIRYRSWNMTILLPLGCFVATAGYATREAGAFQPDSIGILLASTVLTLSAP